MRRIALLLAAATALPLAGMTCIPAAAVTKTVMTRLDGMTSSRSADFPSHTLAAAGYFQPARPSGSPVYIQRHTSTGWHTLATTPSKRYVGGKGPYSQYVYARTGTAWGEYVIRACVHATSTSTAACTPVLDAWLGRYRTNANLPVLSRSAGTTTGTSGDTKGFTLWPATIGSGAITLDLRGGCDTGVVSADVDSSSDTDNNLGLVTFSVYRNNVFWRSVTFPGLAFPEAVTQASLHGVHSLKVTAKGQGTGVAGQFFGFALSTFCTF